MRVLHFVVTDINVLKTRNHSLLATLNHSLWGKYWTQIFCLGNALFSTLPVSHPKHCPPNHHVQGFFKMPYFVVVLKWDEEKFHLISEKKKSSKTNKNKKKNEEKKLLWMELLQWVRTFIKPEIRKYSLV